MNETQKLSEEFLPLRRDEMYEIHGGFLPILAGLIIAGGAAIIGDWDNFKNGLMGRKEVK